jgi:transcriptional regulator with XRE-family HTH domain
MAFLFLDREKSMVISRLRIERVKHGLTQKALADRTGGAMTQCQVSQIELGRPPRPDEKTIIAHVLGVAVDELFPAAAPAPELPPLKPVARV